MSHLTNKITSEVAIIGAGAAGLMCAIEAGRRGRKVILLDHAKKVGEKIRISGGGRCNFTNINAAPEAYLSGNPHFAKSALARFTPMDIIKMVDAHGIDHYEKTLGQLFCRESATQIIAMLIEELNRAGVQLELNAEVTEIAKTDEGFTVTSSLGEINCQSLVIATGGKSIPKMGATGFAYDIARQFGLEVIAPRPGLVPLTFDPDTKAEFAALAGVSLPAIVSCPDASFREALLFTHRGMSGPAILQISSYWREGGEIHINLLPDNDLTELLAQSREAGSKQSLTSLLADHMPKRLAQYLVEKMELEPGFALAQVSNEQIARVAKAVHQWRLKPQGSEGYRTAEVTIGGIATDELSSKTMEARKVSGLYFIGEAVDVTGHLGGYNFQWAWASGHAAGQYV